MTQIEKPFIFPVRALGDPSPVNYNMMNTFSKQEVLDVKNDKTEYRIVWQIGLVAKEGQDIVWRYDSKSCRDSDYNEIVAKISLPLGS